MKPDTPEIIDEIAVRMELVNACALAGGQIDFARAHGVSPQFICDIIKGRQSPSPKILRLIGFERVTRYRKSVGVSSPGATTSPRVGNSPASVGAFSSS